MAEQYFTSNPTSEHKYSKFETEILGNTVCFHTDSGVFSRDGLDFGTRTLLEALPGLYGRVLDLGCGWGAVGVSVGKKYPETEIVMSDVNERAMELAEKNLRENGVTNATVMKSDAMDAVPG
ncbi:MAG: methyltransferase, partial [Clostridia bacterium]|nr:methyltransferase [Clostridia bacterium]